MMELLGVAAIMLATGCVAGIIAGLLGVGGGIVIVPVLFEVLPWLGVPDELRMHIAVGTSLAIIIPTSFNSARSHYAKGAVDTGILKSLGPAVFLGVLVGLVFTGRVRGEILTAIFATIALLVAAQMLLLPKGAALAKQMPGTAGTGALGLFIGWVSVCMGIGGGTVGVPLMTLFSVPIHNAVATASVLGLIIGIPGLIGFIINGWGATTLSAGYLGYVHLLGAILIAPVSTMLAPYGAKIAHSLSPRALKICFGVFLLITAVRMYRTLL
ncbi:MAG: sulfite exporter TauE/SafE family protein [Hyphomicrobiaceae bacterium]|nr:sulfite exporter TauE/SafE family protein [Hyphomicrobiaceae bacterium]